jgi:hypothetical protein
MLAETELESLLTNPALDRLASARLFNATAVTQATVNGLSLGLFDAYRPSVVDPSIVAENHRSRTEQLASLRFLDARSQAPSRYGIQRAQKLLQDNDNPPAEFDDHHASFLTIIRRRTPER